MGGVARWQGGAPLTLFDLFVLLRGGPCAGLGAMEPPDDNPPFHRSVQKGGWVGCSSTGTHTCRLTNVVVWQSGVGAGSDMVGGWDRWLPVAHTGLQWVIGSGVLVG